MPTFDLVTYLTQGASNAPAVIFLVFALTYIAGQLGAKGKVQMSVAMALGFLLGFGLQLATVGVPPTGGEPAAFAGWFWILVYAGLMAVLPVLLYETVKDLIFKRLGA